MITSNKIPRTFATIFFHTATSWCLAEQEWTQLPSPAEGFTISVSISEQGRPQYRVQRAGTDLILPSGLGFELGGGADATAGFERQRSLCQANMIAYGSRSGGSAHRCATTIKPPTRASHIKGRRLALTLEMRAYDEGVAFRYLIDALEGRAREIEIKNEMTEFQFTGNHDLWAVTSAQGKYRKIKLSETPNGIERPVRARDGGGQRHRHRRSRDGRFCAHAPAATGRCAQRSGFAAPRARWCRRSRWRPRGE